ncbi:MAG: tetratricopeptide repeat protein [Planctomycetota bacterium]|nr:tetratricopeptide repeat protein [Planctomycetota bacterium]
MADLTGFGRGRGTLLFALFLAALPATAIALDWRRRRSPVWTGVALALVLLVAYALLFSPSAPLRLRPSGEAWLDGTFLVLFPTVAALLVIGGSAVDRRALLTGLVAGFLVLDVVVVPALGFTLALLVAGAAWLASEMRGGGTEREARTFERFDPGGATRLIAWGAAVGAVVAVAWPFLLQYLPGTRAGWRVPVLVLLGVLPLPLVRGLWSVAVTHAPLLLLGLYIGVAAGEGPILARLEGRPAAILARRRSGARIEGLALDPDGLAQRMRVRAFLEEETLVHLHGVPFERGSSWRRLEEAEVLLPRVDLGLGARGMIVGSALPFQVSLLWPERGRYFFLGGDPVPAPDQPSSGPLAFLFGRAPMAHDLVVFTSYPFQANGVGLRDTVEVLEHAAERSVLWAWCDPRALKPAGVRTVLATWRAAFPGGTLLLLQDTYSGPLLGVRAAEDAFDPFATEYAPFVVASGPVASLVASDAGRAATLDRPLLEWRTAARPSPFPHPRADVLRALDESLIGLDAPARALLLGLVAHAEAQDAQADAANPWDRIVVPEAELEHYLAGLRDDPAAEPLVLHVRRVAEILLEKRELGKVLDLLAEAVRLRDDVAAFHLLLGRVHRALTDETAALAELEIAHALAPDDAPTAAELARAYADAGRHAEAIPLLEAARAKDPRNAALAKGLGLSYLELGRLEEARECLELVRALAPNDREVGQALERIGADD